MSKKVLVTGANGLLGANIVAHLVKKGYEAVAMVRKGSNIKSLQGINCDIFEGDVTSFYDLEKAIDGCDYVIHCAARTKQYPSKLEYYKRINIDSTSQLIMLSKRHNIQKFIYVSTANCFTNGTLDNPGNESGGFMPWLKNSGYAYSKYLAQQMVLDEANSSSFPGIVVAPTFLIGARDVKPSSGKLLLYGFKNRIVFYPPGGKSYADIDFVAEAIINAFEKGHTGSKYLLSGINLSYKDFFKEIRRINKKWQLLIPIPRWFLVIIAFISSFIETIFPISLPLNRTNQRLLCLDNYFDNKKAREELDLQPTLIVNSVKKAHEWFKENDYL